MKRGYALKSSALIVVSILVGALPFVLLFLDPLATLEDSVLNLQLPFLVSLFLFCVGCSLYAVGKGHSPFLGFLGLLGIIGPVIICFF